jgi:uncharacterized membrane protein (DUF4010 family)
MDLTSEVVIAGLTPLELAGRLGLALALALFIGLAFEEIYKREDRSSPGGIRSFPMLTTAGATLYLVEPRYALAFLGGLFVLGLWMQAYLREAPARPNATSLMIPGSALVAYVLGPIALTQQPWMVVAVAVSAALLLSTREQLHRVTQLVPQDELLTAGKFLVLVGIILPLVPDEPVTTLTALTPFKIWLAVVAICSLSYASYLLQRYVRLPDATLLPAILGGLYSSTVTTIVLAKQQREVSQVRADLSAGIVAATAIMYVRLGIVTALFNFKLAVVLAPALAALFVIGVIIAIAEWRSMKEPGGADISVPVVNPLQIPTAVLFAVILVVISIVTVWTRTAFGQSGILALAAIVGVTDIDPFVVNIAQGGVSGVASGMLAAAVLIAASANNIAKACYAVGFGGKLARRPAIELGILAALGLIAAASVIWLMGVR